MNSSVLVTGGAGFVGTHLARRLLREGCAVAILDNFNSQIHGSNQELPPDLASEVELFRGNVQDDALVSRALRGQDVVVHLAAETGTGQSMYEVRRYEDTNIGGTASLSDTLVNDRKCSASKIVLASSRAVYGEGQYRCAQDGIVFPGARPASQLRKGVFEPLCPVCETPCQPEATPEEAPLRPLSFYGLTKRVQEDMLLMLHETTDIPVCALRFQNVYGPGQSLSNPYTGILAIFSNLARSRTPIQIFEDGQESRDFVYVEDTVEAIWRFISGPAELSGVYNVGTGVRTTVMQVAEQISTFFGGKSQIKVTGAFRQGDIRHNFADLTKLKRAIGFAPRYSFNEGVRKFLAWATEQGPQSGDAYESSLQEMSARGLYHE